MRGTKKMKGKGGGKSKKLDLFSICSKMQAVKCTINCARKIIWMRSLKKGLFLRVIVPLTEALVPLVIRARARDSILSVLHLTCCLFARLLRRRVTCVGGALCGAREALKQIGLVSLYRTLLTHERPGALKFSFGGITSRVFMERRVPGHETDRA